MGYITYRSDYFPLNLKMFHLTCAFNRSGGAAIYYKLQPTITANVRWVVKPKKSFENDKNDLEPLGNSKPFLVKAKLVNYEKCNFSH